MVGGVMNKFRLWASRTAQRLAFLRPIRRSRKSIFRFSIPLINNSDHYRELLRKAYERDEEARTTFLKNMLIGNAAGLVAISALLTRWPFTSELVRAMLPAGVFYAIGVCTAASAGLFQREIHHRVMVRMAWRAKLLDEQEDHGSNFSKTRKRLQTINRRLRRMKVPLISSLSLLGTMIAFLLGTALALTAVALMPHPSNTQTIDRSPLEFGRVYQL